MKLFTSEALYLIKAKKFFKTIDLAVCIDLRMAGLLDWTFRNDFLQRELLQQRLTRSMLMVAKIEILIHATEYPDTWPSLTELSYKYHPWMFDNTVRQVDSDDSYDSDSTNINSDGEWDILDEDFENLMTESYH